MKKEQPELRALLQMQLTAVPIVNQAVQEFPFSSGGLRLSIRLQRRGWSRVLGGLLPLSHEKKLELDPIGAEVFQMFDGQHTLEEIIDIYRERWNLSFFESRAVILEFLRRLGRYDLILFKIRAPTEGQK
jgi:hypothetical protein